MRERGGGGAANTTLTFGSATFPPPGIQVEMAREITPGAKLGDNRLPLPSWNARV